MDDELFFTVYLVLCSEITQDFCDMQYSLILKKIHTLSNKFAYQEIYFLKFLFYTYPFLGPLIGLFWTSGDISSGFQGQNGQSYLHLAEGYVTCIP